MEINEDKRGDVVILSLSGRLDVTTAKTFHERIFSVIDSGVQRLVVDFSQLEYVSSSGLRVFYQVSVKLKEKGGRIVFCRLSDPVKRVFDIVDMAADFPIFVTREEAIENLS